MPIVERHPDRFFRSAMFARVHLEDASTGISIAEAICYARTWDSSWYCRFKKRKEGFQCTNSPHEVFDRERKKLRIGERIPQMYIAFGRRTGMPGYWWGWSDKPWIWD